MLRATVYMGTNNVRCILQRLDWLLYTKKDTLHLSDMHRVCRLAWSEEMLILPSARMSIILSDENEWSLDGPDGLQLFWRDMRVAIRQTNRRQMGGGSVMVWGGFSEVGKTEMAILVGNQKSEDYIYTISEYLRPFSHREYGTEFLFQQDNAAIHTSSMSTEFFAEQGVNVMDWPARSPDLNRSKTCGL